MSKHTSTIKTTRSQETKERLSFAATAEISQLFSRLETDIDGINEETVEDARDRYGNNHITHRQKETILRRFFKAFVNPFTAILAVLAIVSVFTDIIMTYPDDSNPMTVIIITVMVLVSGAFRFVQETRSGHAAENLLQMIHTTTCVKRKGREKQELPLEEVVVGDIIYLAAGDMIPADLRIFQAKDLFISQSALTGESVAVEKNGSPCDSSFSLTEMPNLAFMGCDVISGSATGVVIATGSDTIFGEIAKSITVKPVPTSFEKGVNSVSWLLIRFMLIMVPLVLLVNGFKPGNSWMNAILFALAVAVGLTPEMLPMIVTTCLAKGAVAMSHEKTIIKNLNSIQNLGSMDILCTDKTGTLTQDKVILMYHLDIHGQENQQVFHHAFLNSYYQTGLKNLMDVAILSAAEDENEPNHLDLKEITTRFVKVDEVPFDFVRRRMSVVVANDQNEHLMITKGAVEEMLEVSTFVDTKDQITPLTDEIRQYILQKVEDFNEDGMRVIAIASKANPSPVGAFSTADEKDMVLMGYLAFLDPPKESTAAAIKALNEHGVTVKILTGDNDKVTRCICRQVELPVNRIVLGSELEEMDDAILQEVVEKVNVFAKLSPTQKSRVIKALQENGHSVGYMGDGINDAAAMKASDVGISVDTAVDIAKESADVILLEKDLRVLEKGLLEGRKTYANMVKYIKMTASSNFGNIFSLLVASAFLPFIPMLPIHLILLNLIYDLSCTTIPWDNVDREFLTVPRKWNASSIGKFMLWFGPISSVFDIAFFIILYFIICPAVVGGQQFHQITDVTTQVLFIAIFHAGWFVASMWTQTFVIHMLRTPKLAFIKSHASWSLTLLTFTGIAVLTAIPFTAFGSSIGLAALPSSFFPWLGATVFLYMVVVTWVKKIFVKRYGELL